MSIALTYKTFQCGLMLFSFSKQNVLGSIMADDFPKEGQALFEIGYLSEGPVTTVVPDRWSDELNEWVDAEWNPETGTYQYDTISALGIESVDVPDEDVKTYDISLDWMVNHIRDLVEIEPSVQVRVITPNLLWELGHIWIGRQKATIFLGKDLSCTQEFDRVYDAFLDWEGKSPGVILTNNAPERRHAEIPGGHRILDLKKIVVETASGYEMDMELLHGTLQGTHVPTSMGPVVPSPDYSSLKVHGREFIFPGDKQKRMIKILFRAWRMGNPKYRTKTALAEIESSGHALSHLFNRHPDWKDLIGYGGGFCWLKV